MNTKIKILKNLAVTALIAAVIGLASCEKYIWDPPTFEPPDTTGGFDTIFFSTQIAPLFPQYGCTACHGGFVNPDLTPANSYNSLTTGGYINTTNPPSSSIVERMQSSSHGQTFSAVDVKLMIDWIYQGTLDN